MPEWRDEADIVWGGDWGLGNGEWGMGKGGLAAVGRLDAQLASRCRCPHARERMRIHERYGVPPACLPLA